MYSHDRSFTERFRILFHQMAEGFQELSAFGQGYVLVLFRRNGQLLYRLNAGTAILILAIVDLLYPAIVVLGLLTGFILGIRARFERVY